MYYCSKLCFHNNIHVAESIILKVVLPKVLPRTNVRCWLALFNDSDFKIRKVFRPILGANIFGKYFDANCRLGNARRPQKVISGKTIQQHLPPSLYIVS